MGMLEDAIAEGVNLEVTTKKVGTAFLPILCRKVSPNRTETFHICRQSYRTEGEAINFGQNALSRLTAKVSKVSPIHEPAPESEDESDADPADE